MAVYTEVSDQELAAFLRDYDIGRAVSLQGITEGVENSNYLLRTDQDSFILTLYEKRVVLEDLPYFLGLMDHLAAEGIACPTPIHGRDGEALRGLCGRPAAIISFLEGLWPQVNVHKRLCFDPRSSARRLCGAAPEGCRRGRSTPSWPRSNFPVADAA